MKLIRRADDPRRVDTDRVEARRAGDDRRPRPRPHALIKENMDLQLKHCAEAPSTRWAH